MVIPTFLIIPPSIVAVILYLWLYFERDPVNRITDRRFLLAIASFGVIVGQLFVMVQRYDPVVPSRVLFGLALALLLLAIQMVRVRPPRTIRERGR